MKDTLRHGDAPAARSLLLTVLGTHVQPSGAPVWTGALVEALGALGVEEKAVRQAIGRSATDGRLDGERVGRRVRFHLSPWTREVLDEGQERVFQFRPVRQDWDGTWLLLIASVPESSRPLRNRLRTRLAWIGFGPLGQGVWINPDADRQKGAEAALASLGPAVEASSFLARHGTIGDANVLVSRAWELPSLRSRYGTFISRFETRSPHSPTRTFQAHTELLHEWRKFPFVDPGLPESLVPREWPGRRAQDLFDHRHAEWWPIAKDWFDEVNS
ncbi:MAG: PaaX family transcriptional regulator [Acidimicrobiia bacterium]